VLSRGALEFGVGCRALALRGPEGAVRSDVSADASPTTVTARPLPADRHGHRFLREAPADRCHLTLRTCFPDGPYGDAPRPAAGRLRTRKERHEPGTPYQSKSTGSARAAPRGRVTKVLFLAPPSTSPFAGLTSALHVRACTGKDGLWIWTAELSSWELRSCGNRPCRHRRYARPATGSLTREPRRTKNSAASGLLRPACVRVTCEKGPVRMVIDRAECGLVDITASAGNALSPHQEPRRFDQRSSVWAGPNRDLRACRPWTTSSKVLHELHQRLLFARLGAPVASRDAGESGMCPVFCLATGGRSER
jgi:hypothetical protein